MTEWSQAAPHFTGTAVAHVATIDEDGAPHVVPVWVDREGPSALTFFTIEGTRKDRNIARDPRVALSITAPDNAFDMASVQGVVVERLEGERAMAVVDRLSHAYTGEPYEQRSGFVAFVVEPRTWSARDYAAE